MLNAAVNLWVPAPEHLPQVKLTVAHDGCGPGNKVFKSISGGWPAFLSSLKSLLETSKPLSIKLEPPKEMIEALKALKG